jgi:transposase-like protein
MLGMDSAALRVQPCLVPVSVDSPNVRRFGAWSYVQDAGAECLVVVRGALIGRFSRSDHATRNVLLVAAYQSCKRGEIRALARAFQVASGTLWYLNDAFQEGGAKALVERSHGGVRYRRLTESKQRRAEKLFDAGATVSEVKKATGLSQGSVSKARTLWQQHSQAVETPAPTTVEEEDQEFELIATCEPRSHSPVQHAGSWLLLAMTAALGLHATAEQNRPSKLKPALLRLALNAFVTALAVGERCAEGIRRLGTASAGALLFAAHAPSASWVRRVLHRFADDGNGGAFQFAVAGQLSRAAAQGDDVAVFYVDNHLRPYSGQQVLRKGWRMQDRCAVPGTTDYYVHDEDGRPVFRADSPGHASLAAVLTPAAACLRLAVGEEQPIVLAFDRGGSFPSAMADLRDAGIGFVTYERRPYALLAKSDFARTITLDNGERVGLCEAHEKNLGRGRGRVRRICLRMEDGHQVNLLAISDLASERLVEVMSGRWRQENAFKHGKERWGINQLDGRRCEPVPPGTIIPNPARRRLEHALGLVRRWGGEVRNRLARVGAGERSREGLAAQLVETVTLREQYESQRPTLPMHAPVEQTELAGKLERHEPDYKMALDAVRTICANAESELAAIAGPLLPKPREAKRLLRSLFSAPGRIDVRADVIRIALQPAGSGPELKALARMCELLDRKGLVHPGDPHRRRLEFRAESAQRG